MVVSEDVQYDNIENKRKQNNCVKVNIDFKTFMSLERRGCTPMEFALKYCNTR